MLGNLFMYKLKRSGLRLHPCLTPYFTGKKLICSLLVFEHMHALA